MRASVFVLVVLVGTCVLSAVPDDSNESSWLAFKTQYGKVYPNELEDSMRKALFVERKRNVNKFNREQSSEAGYTIGINHMSDWTPSEISKLTGSSTGDSHKRRRGEARQFLESINGGNLDLPASVDWRKVPGRVTSVKNQGFCSSSWAFSTVGVLEGQEASYGKKELVDLSVQQLIDCSASNYHSCTNGFTSWYFEVVASLNGIESEKAYPYEATINDCHFNVSKVEMNLKKIYMLDEGDEKGLQMAVDKLGPVAVDIDGARDSFYSYKSGVYYDDNCAKDPQKLTHSLLVVGYGTDSKQGDYWIVKNSWGEHWGDKGYGLIARNRNNTCGIASLATFVKV